MLGCPYLRNDTLRHLPIHPPTLRYVHAIKSDPNTLYGLTFDMIIISAQCLLIATSLILTTTDHSMKINWFAS